MLMMILWGILLHQWENPDTEVKLICPELESWKMLELRFKTSLILEPELLTNEKINKRVFNINLYHKKTIFREKILIKTEYPRIIINTNQKEDTMDINLYTSIFFRYIIQWPLETHINRNLNSATASSWWNRHKSTGLYGSWII